MVKTFYLIILLLLSSCFETKVIPKNPILEKNNSPIIPGNPAPTGAFLSPTSRMMLSQGTILPISLVIEDDVPGATAVLYRQGQFNGHCSSGGTMLSGPLALGSHSLEIDTSLFPVGESFLCLEIDDGANDPTEVWSERMSVINASLYTFLVPNSVEMIFSNNGSMMISWADTDHPASELKLDIYLNSVPFGSCDLGQKIVDGINESSLQNTYDWNIKAQNISPGIYYLCLRRSGPHNAAVDVWSTPIIVATPIVRPATIESFETGVGTTGPGVYGNAGVWHDNPAVAGNHAALGLTAATIKRDFSVEFLVKFPDEGFYDLNADYSRTNLKNIQLFSTNGVTCTFGISGLNFQLKLLSKTVNLAMDLKGVGVNAYSYFLDQEWHHIVVTRSSLSGKAKLYIDGKSNDQMEIAVPAVDLFGGGTSIGDTTSSFSLDEFRIYQEALPPAMVDAHYSEFLSSTPFSIVDPGHTPDSYDVNIYGEYDPLDFARGFPRYHEATYSQLANFPRPQFRRGHHILRNTWTLMPGYLIYNDDLSQADNNILTKTEKILRFQKELVEFNNYALSMDGSGHIVDQNSDAAQNSVSEYINLRKDVPLEYKTFWIAQQEKGTTILGHPESWSAEYILTDGVFAIDYQGDVARSPYVTLNPAVFGNVFHGSPTPNDFFKGDSDYQGAILDSALDAGMITRPINMIFENDEYIGGYSGFFPGLVKDSLVVADFIDRYLNGTTKYYIGNCSGPPYIRSFDLTYFNVGATNALKLTPSSYTGLKACELNALWVYSGEDLRVNLWSTFVRGYLDRYAYNNNAHPSSPTCSSSDPWIAANGCSVELKLNPNPMGWDGVDMQYTYYFQYQIAGFTTNNWGKARELLPPIHGERYASHMNYINMPKDWYRRQVTPFSWGMGSFWDSRLTEVTWGDHHAAPATSGGWNGDNGGVSNLLPSQFLAILKFESILGAEIFHLANFQHDAHDPRGMQINPQYYVFQLAVPSLAQSVTSHYEDIFRTGYFLTGNEWKIKDGDLINPIVGSGEYQIEILDGNFLTPVYVRRHMNLDRFAIATGIMRQSNIKDTVPESLDVKIRLFKTGAGAWSETFALKARRQGSVYLFDRTDPNGKLFYQLDEWHESSHFTWWSHDIQLEAELYDTLQTPSTTMKVTETVDPEYSDATTFLQDLAQNEVVTMHFDNKYEGNNTYHIWAKVRSIAGANLSVQLKKTDVFRNIDASIVGAMTTGSISDTSGRFEWVEVGIGQVISDRTQIVLEIKETAGVSLDLD